MFYHERLNDDYEIHQRNHGYLKDDLDILVADAKVKRQSWHKNVMACVGDVLISVDNSMKERNGKFKSTTLFPLMRRRNETVSQ